MYVAVLGEGSFRNGGWNGTRVIISGVETNCLEFVAGSNQGSWKTNQKRDRNPRPNMHQMDEHLATKSIAETEIQSNSCSQWIKETSVIETESDGQTMFTILRLIKTQTDESLITKLTGETGIKTNSFT